MDDIVDGHANNDILVPNTDEYLSLYIRNNIKPHYDIPSPVVYKFLVDDGHHHDFCNKFKYHFFNFWYKIIFWFSVSKINYIWYITDYSIYSNYYVTTMYSIKDVNVQCPCINPDNEQMTSNYIIKKI